MTAGLGGYQGSPIVIDIRFRLLDNVIDVKFTLGNNFYLLFFI